MTKSRIEEFAVGYPYPADYVEILLKKYEILCGGRNEVINEIQTK